MDASPNNATIWEKIEQSGRWLSVEQVFVQAVQVFVELGQHFRLCRFSHVLSSPNSRLTGSQIRSADCQDSV